MNLPWSKSTNNGMVSLIDSAGHVVTEIYPGQILGVVPTIERREEIADFILRAVNAKPFSVRVTDSGGISIEELG